MHATLGLIGRAHTVESDEIPSDDNSFVAPILNYEEYRLIIPSLAEKTRTLRFFKHSFLRTPDYKKFHCLEFGVIQNEINFLLFYYQKLQSIDLLHNILYRHIELIELLNHLKRLIANESQNLQIVRDKPEAIATNECRLEYLRSLCDNLRMGFNNFSSLLSYVQNSKVIQQRLYRFRDALDKFHQIYQILSSRLIQLSQEFVSKGLLVLSHLELSRFTHDDLWEIARGIEEYNIVIDHSLLQKRLKLLKDFYYYRNLPDLNGINRHIDQQITGIRIMSFSRILYKLASERSLLIAHNVHRFFFQLPCLSEELLIYWKTGHFNSGKILKEMEVIGSPVNDYLRLEYEFTSNFLDIISQSTEMLKELSSNTNLPKRKLHKEDTVENFMAPLTETREKSPSPQFTSKTSSFLSVSSAASSKSNSPTNKPRKGVQWSDHKDVSLRHQVISRYLSVVWKMVDSLLIEAKHLNWSSDLPLGPWTLINRRLRKLVADIIEKMATTNYFPAGFIPVLQHQVELVQYEILLSDWDYAMWTDIFTATSPSHPREVAPDSHVPSSVSSRNEQLHHQLLQLTLHPINIASLRIFNHIQNQQYNSRCFIRGVELRGESIQTPLQQMDPTTTLVSVLYAGTLPIILSYLSWIYSKPLHLSQTSDAHSLNSSHLFDLAQIIWKLLHMWKQIQTFTKNLPSQMNQSNVVNPPTDTHSTIISNDSSVACTLISSPLTQEADEVVAGPTSCINMSVDVESSTRCSVVIPNAPSQSQSPSPSSCYAQLSHSDFLLQNTTTTSTTTAPSITSIHQHSVSSTSSTLADSPTDHYSSSSTDSLQKLYELCLQQYVSQCRVKLAQLFLIKSSPDNVKLQPCSSDATYVHAIIMTLLQPLLLMSQHHDYYNNEDNNTTQLSWVTEAITFTLDTICEYWLNYAQSRLINHNQLADEVGILRDWLTDNCAGLSMVDLSEALIQLENYAIDPVNDTNHEYQSNIVINQSDELTNQKQSSSNQNYAAASSSVTQLLQRQTSEMSQKVMKGCAWIGHELLSRSSGGPTAATLPRPPTPPVASSHSSHIQSESTPQQQQQHHHHPAPLSNFPWTFTK